MWNRRHLHGHPMWLPHPPCNSWTQPSATANWKSYVHQQLYHYRHTYCFNVTKSIKSIWYALLFDMRPHPSNTVKPHMSQSQTHHDRPLHEASPCHHNKMRYKYMICIKNSTIYLHAKTVCKGVLLPTTVYTVRTYPGSSLHAEVVPVIDKYIIEPVRHTPHSW